MVKMYLNYICLLLCYIPSFGVADVLLYLYGEPMALDEFKDMPSAFGGEIPYEGLSGKIKYAEPADGCKSIVPAPTEGNSSQLWFALISRNNCSFEKKIRNAQSANYDAVIVHNVGSDYTEEMSVNNATGIEIPSLFIGEHDGLYLKRKFIIPDLYYVLITPDAPFNVNTHLLLPFAIVVSICFLVMVIYMVVKCIKDRRRQRRQRLPASALNKMLIHKFDTGDPYETCAICLDDYVKGEKLRVLPCAHAYHSKCIDPWLTNSRRVCPVCKRKVLAGDPDSDNSDSDTDDDTTPLVNPTNQNRTHPLSEADRQRIRDVARSLFMTSSTLFPASDNHSINGETSVEVSTSNSDSSTSSTESHHGCSDDEVLHVHTRQDGENNSESTNHDPFNV